MNRQMFSTCQQLILASSSPRRQQFLRDLGITFTVITTDVDETPMHNEQPAAFALRIARTKAMPVATVNSGGWVIGADTVVTLPDGTILGKPDSKKQALDMLSRLNNATHLVMTGACLCCLDKEFETTLVETTEVTFMDIPEEVLWAYVQTGEPLDKAGAYGIQGLGSFLVKSINGSCTNVIGLPVNRLVSLLLTNKIIKPLP